MSEEAIPVPVRDFLAHHLESVVQLEVLLLLQAHADRSYTAAEVARELRIDPAGAAEQLSRLCADGLLECTTDPQPLYRYAPGTAELDQTVAALSQVYNDRRVTVINLIYSKPMDKIRIFADAFRIRKEKGDG